MPHYFVLLRGVNVSGKNTIKMANLKSHLLLHGFTQVQTYIQSGNILLHATEEDAIMVQRQVENLIKKEFLLEVACFVFPAIALEFMLQQNPFSNKEGNNNYFTILRDEPSPEQISKLISFAKDQELIYFHTPILYTFLPLGMGNTKLTNSKIEQVFQTTATGRNRNTMEKLWQLYLSIE